ncbi:MAG: PHB depolymerase family esterase [Agarilytica sp.]
MAKTITHLIRGAAFSCALFASHSFAGPCNQVTDSVSNLADQGLAEFYYSFYRASGDLTYLGLSASTSATVFSGGDGQGYSNDPGDCGDSTTSGWRTDSIAGMSVHLYVPEGEGEVAPHVTGKRPLMLSLHGCFQSNSLIRDKGNWQQTADRYGMVVAVPDSVTTGYGNCWDSFDDGHTPLNHDNDNVILLTETLRDDASLNIDPNQMYIAGLSSGGMQTMLVGCMRPDLYAGLGLGSNPTIGTGSTEWGSDPAGPIEGTNLCLDLAASTGTSGHQTTQLASIVFGDDSTSPGGMDEPSNGIDLDFFPQNAEIMATIYGASLDGSPSAVAGYSSSQDGFESTWSDSSGKRVSMLDIPGLGHAWSSGNGMQDTDLNGDYVDYPAFVMAFFHHRNLRVNEDGNTPPVVTLLGNASYTLVDGDPWEDPGATAFDEEDGDLSEHVEILNPVDPNEPGYYPVDYCVTDAAGATTCALREVTVFHREPTPTVTPTPSCEDVDDYNYYHKTNGRAYSSGSYWSPDYFASGSDDILPGSTWGRNIVRSYDGGSEWERGACQ